MVGHLVLVQAIGVRSPVSEPNRDKLLRTRRVVYNILKNNHFMRLFFNSIIYKYQLSHMHMYQMPYHPRCVQNDHYFYQHEKCH